MNTQETGRILAVLKATWPDRTINEETVGSYHRALGDLDYAALCEATGYLVQTSRFFPTPAELRDAVLDVVIGVIPPELAWEEVRYQMAEVGHHGTPSWSNPVLADAVRAIGWGDLCRSDIEQASTNRAQFRDAYAAARKRFSTSPAIVPALEAAMQRRAEFAAAAVRSSKLEAYRQEQQALPEASSQQMIGSGRVYERVPGEPWALKKARERFEKQQAGKGRIPNPKPNSLALLQSLPAWRDLTPEYRQWLLTRPNRHLAIADGEKRRDEHE
jgi:hypothetical protein